MSNGLWNYMEKTALILEDALEKAVSSSVGGVAMKHAEPLLAGLRAGKKIRGCLCCLIAQALGGVLESAMPRAVAVELIHAATLIHDDFVDQDRVRRERPAAWTLEGARRAVLIGDVIFATAIWMMNEASREDGLAVSQAIAELSKGALSEPLDPRGLAGDIENGTVDGRLYDNIILLKTGILFGTACLLGARASGASVRLCGRAYRYGLRIGEAYQIADDLQEMREHLALGSIRPEQMATLAPAFLRLGEDAVPSVLKVLKGEETVFDRRTGESFRRATAHLEREMESRLQSAKSEIEGHFPANAYTELAIRAPGDIIRMANGS
jgi:geranylgeranyl pyrophosphate synthase